MNAALQPSLQKLEERKTALLSQISRWSPERQRFRPGPSTWSALDVLDHLVKVEQALVRAVRSNLPEGHPQRFKERVGAFLVLWVMQSPMRIKVPASSTSVLPETTADPAQIAADWANTRRDIHVIVDRLQPEQLGRGMFLHPVSGWMTVSQGLAFLSAHLRHHSYQVDRLERSSRSR